MISEFDFSEAPFSFLTAEQQSLLRRHLSLEYFPAGTIIVKFESAAPGLYRVMKGHVLAFQHQAQGRQLFSDYHEGDLFAAYGLPEQRAHYEYQAAEDSICYLLNRETFLQLLDENSALQAWFSGALEHKSRGIQQRDDLPELAGMMLSRVGDIRLHQPVWVNAHATIREVTEKMQAADADAALAVIGSDTGIVTRTDLLRALTQHHFSPDSAIGPIASYPLIAVREEDFLMQALLTMTRHRIDRVAVTHEDGVMSLLGMNEILSHFSTHSHIITLRIARAQQLSDLTAIASDMHRLTATLYQHGVHMQALGELIGALNAQLMERVFTLTFPVDWQDDCCLLALGSEGRHEQLLRTDQDNALVLARDPDTALVQAAEAFSAALLQLGFPPCPGQIMVNNPYWRRTTEKWSESILRWAERGEAEAFMHLGLLSDARAVAGNTSLLNPIEQTMKQLASNKIFLRAIVAEALAFQSAFTIFGRLRSDRSGIDLKKGGIFPLVHGIRVLALEAGIRASSSFDRIERLRELNILRSKTAANLKQALAVLMRLRLNQQLSDYRFAEAPDNAVYPERMRYLDRELLRDALRVVEQLKELLKSRFQL